MRTTKTLVQITPDIAALVVVTAKQQPAQIGDAIEGRTCVGIRLNDGVRIPETIRFGRRVELFGSKLYSDWGTYAKDDEGACWRELDNIRVPGVYATFQEALRMGEAHARHELMKVTDAVEARARALTAAEG